jgi:hypothetical protein
MRHQFAAVHELARIEMLAGLPGETLTVLAARMRRETLAPGESIPEAQVRERFYVLISGMLRAPSGRVVRPGEAVGQPTPLDESLRAIVPSTVASCDEPTFEELVRPLLGPV